MIQGKFLTEQEAQSIATRQILSFLLVPDEQEGGSPNRIAYSKSFFFINELPEGADQPDTNNFNWTNLNIFDINGILLFRDQIMRISQDREIRVRTAAQDVLRSPVWTVSAGPILDFERLRLLAIEVIKEKYLGQLILEDENKLICYSYPKLGLMCLSVDTAQKFIFDIGDLVIIPIELSPLQLNSDTVDVVWSPYDSVVPSTIGQFRILWEENINTLPEIPEAGLNLTELIFSSRNVGVEEVVVNPELQLIGQDTNKFCAVATAAMIFDHHNIRKTQVEIATAMKTDDLGSTPRNQEASIAILSAGSLKGTNDNTPSFEEATDELLQNRPFKSGIVGHARACGGYKIDGDRRFLYIYDPWPPLIGAIYFEDYTALLHTNHMYIRPALLS